MGNRVYYWVWLRPDRFSCKVTRCIGWRKHNRANHPIYYPDNTLVKTGSESIEATLRRRQILFAGFVARMEDTRLPKCVMFEERVGARAVWGRAGMAQNGRTRGGTFDGKKGRCRKKQGWTTACSGMLERDRKNQGEDSPKQAGSCWFARPCRLATSGANLCPPGVWFADRCHGVFLWCYVGFVLLRFRLYAFVEAAALGSIALRYASAPIATRVYFYFYLEMSLFRSIFLYYFRFLFVWRVRPTFFPSE